MTGTTGLAVAVPAALAAAAAFGLAAARQHQQAQQTSSGTGAPRLLARLARDPRWLAAAGLSVLGYALQALALAFGPLTLVAPIVASDLLFALPLAARRAGRRLTGRDWLGCLLTAAGIAVFLAVAPESSGRSSAPAAGWLLAFAVVAALCAAALATGRLAGPAARPAATAAAAGLIYGLTAAVTLSLTRLARTEDLWRLPAHWQPWALAALGLSGLALTMGAFQTGGLGASLPVIDTVEPVSGVLIGTLLFGEPLAATPGGLAGQVLAAGAAVAGITLLARRAGPPAPAPAAPSRPATAASGAAR